MSDTLVVRTVRVEHESGAWAEIRANRSRAVDRALRMNTWFRDIGPVLSPLVLGWGRDDGPMTVEQLVTEAAEPVMSDDGEREIVPARTVARVETVDLLPPAEDPNAYLTLSDCDPDLANWLLGQVLMAPATLLEHEKKDGTPAGTVSDPSDATPGGTPDSAAAPPTPGTPPTRTRSRRSRTSSTRPAASTSA